MKTLWAKLVSAFRSLLAGTRQLFYVVWTASRKELADILNDKELQQLALYAVRRAAQKGVSAEERWEIAFGYFKAVAEAKGWEPGTAILESILQTAYTVYKYTEGNGKDAKLQTSPTPRGDRGL